MQDRLFNETIDPGETDEEFIMKRRKTAHKDFIEGNTIDAYQVISTLKSKKK